MKKLISVGVALAFAVSLATVASAGRMAGPAKSVAQPPVPGNPAGAVKQAAPARMSVAGKEAKRHQITGVVKAVDEDAGTLTVQGRKRSASLKAGEKVTLAKIQVGDKVLVIYTGDTASSIKKVSGKKATPRKMAAPVRKEMTPAEKK